MPLFLNALLLLGELWLLAALLLILHRFSPKIGLSPLHILLGALTAALQFNSMGMLVMRFPNHTFHLTLVSFILLPLILLGLLVIYIINGTTHARSTIFGVGLVTIGIALYQALPVADTTTSWITLNFIKPTGFTPYLLLTSIIALLTDFVVLMVVYQGISNLRGHYPSRLAGITALMVAVLVDAVLFPTLNYAGKTIMTTSLSVHVIGKLIGTLCISPLLFFYLKRVALTFPNTAADMPRPTLDLFTTTVQLEARTRYQYNLLRVLTQVHQLILRAGDLTSLLEKTCQFLTSGQDYDLVLIRLSGKDVTGIKHHVSGSEKDQDLIDYLSQVDFKVYQKAQVQVWKYLHHATLPEWVLPFRQHGYQSAGIFPMRHGSQTIGGLITASRKAGKYQSEEIDLLQELADDLAYALVNLDYQKQQAILHAGAQNMQDGMIITGLQGDVIYINPAGAAMITALTPDELVGKNIREALLPENRHIFDNHRPVLLEQGQVTGEIETNRPDGKTSYYTVRAALVKDNQGRSKQMVFNFQDITLRRQYEHQLLTLNNFINELVQIHDINVLMLSLLKAAEELLDAQSSGIYLVNSSNQIINTVTSNLSVEYVRRIAAGYSGMPGETVLKHACPEAVEDVLNHPTYGERIHFMADYGIRSLLVLPVNYQEQLMGAMVVYYNQPHKYYDEELQLAQTLAHTLAIATHNARLYQSEHSQRTLAEALAQAAAVLNTALDLDLVLDQILEQTLRVAECRSVNILMFDDEMAYPVRRRDANEIAGALRELDTQRVPLSIPTFKYMLSMKKPILIRDTADDERWTNIPGSERIKSYAGAPLLIDQQVVGFINVDSNQPNFFTEETTRRLEAFAAYAATAIQNARLYQRLQQYANELEDRVAERTGELQEAKKFIEGILSSVPDAVFVLDENNGLVQANQAGETLLSRAKTHQLDLFAPQMLSDVFRSLTPAEKNIIEVQGQAYQPLASELALEGQPVGKVLVFRDVTGFRELDKMKTQFVSDVSHELRTPLTNMTIYLDLLQNVADANKKKLYLETLRRETSRLTHLIEDLLTISRLEAGRVELYIKPVNVNRLISELANDRTIMANSREIILTCKPAADLPMAMADAHMLNQAISNLLTNAINYTPPNGVICLQTGRVQEDATDWVVIHIADNGVGITPEEIDHIFERFYRGTASYHTKASGTGLGLPISREIVEHMNGRLTVESTPKVGSTFTVWLRAVL